MTSQRSLSASGLPVLALVFNALAWGLSWWPLRELDGMGLHPLWTTTIMFALAAVVIGLFHRHAWREIFISRALWTVVLAAGATNAAFNWAVTTGDVVRVVLLFYMMPLWAALLARWLLKEALTPMVLLRVVLAVAGAAAVLWPAEATSTALPLPRTLSDFLGLAGGFFFALNNVMLRKESERSGASRSLAMFVGGVAVAGGSAVLLASADQMAWLPSLAWPWVIGVTALGMVFLCSNFALQYGAGKLTANVAALVMLSEVVFATVSSVWLGSAELKSQVLWGGALIMLAALLALASEPTPSPHPSTPKQS